MPRRPGGQSGTLTGQRAKLSASAEVAEERSAAARGRLPDLEAGKKADSLSKSKHLLCCAHVLRIFKQGTVLKDIFI